MLVDSHAHAFPPMGGRSGFKTTYEHMRYCQNMLVNHHQPSRRMEDNTIINHQTLYDGTDVSMTGLTKVNFRGDTYGKFAWTVDGENYCKQYLPPTLTKLHAPPELMLAQMDYVGVDRAVFQTGHSYGRLNRYLSSAVAKYPDRFWALAMVDEWQADRPSQTRALDKALGELGLHGLWFQPTNLPLHGRTEALDNQAFYPFWDHVGDLGIPVYLNVDAIEPGQEPYLASLASFNRWLKRYPHIPVIYPHGLPLARFMDNGNISIPEEAWKVLEAPNLIVEILIPIFQGAVWEYPFFEAQPIIRQYYERLGPDKLAWASDMPNVERHCTYRQSLDYLRRHCNFIPSHHMSKICGDNIARLFND